MKKKWSVLIAAGAMAMAMSFSAFAGEWKQDQVGWWYQNDDGSYLNNGWNWINDKCYYFTPEGYCLINTFTPDGYTVDANGAWVINGVVQTQFGLPATTGGEQTLPAAGSEVYSISGLSLTVPAGFTRDPEMSDESSVYLDNGSGVIAMLSQQIPDIQGYEAFVDLYAETLLDMAMNEVGTPTAKEVKTFTSGIWYCYLYNGTSQFNIPVDSISEQIYLYARIKDAKVQLVMIVGNTGMTPDFIMENYLR